MADFAIYWRNYAFDCEDNNFGPSRPLPDWRTNLDRFQVGDRLWFVTAGDACGTPVPTGGYLVNAFIIDRVVPNIGDDGEYLPEDFKTTLWSAAEQAVFFDPPINVDAAFRGSHPAATHIGTLLQSPRRLDDATVARFQTLTGNRPELA